MAISPGDRRAVSRDAEPFDRTSNRRCSGKWPFKQSGSRIAYRIRQEYGQMPLINIVIALIIVGVALWLINRFIPMASSIKTILNVVVVVAVCVWVLQATGIWGPLSSYRLSR